MRGPGGPGGSRWRPGLPGRGLVGEDARAQPRGRGKAAYRF